MARKDRRHQKMAQLKGKKKEQKKQEEEKRELKEEEKTMEMTEEETKTEMKEEEKTKTEMKEEEKTAEMKEEEKTTEMKKVEVKEATKEEEQKESTALPTENELEELTRTVITKCGDLKTSPHYANFLQKLVWGLAETLDQKHIKELGTSVDLLHRVKVLEKKEEAKKNKKAKKWLPKLGVDRASNVRYDRCYDDDDDYYD